jgi:NAD(P)-dependent dehydrogenase (short-subunit alcohol dehydrogenase family)
LKDFNGRRALVTGAASGLGRCLALSLAERGADVVVVDVNEGGLGETAAAVEAKGRRCLARRVDVSDYAAMWAMAEEVISDWGGVDLLVNNAGVGVGGELKDVPIEDFEWIVGINLMGEVYGTKLFLPGMLERGSGHILNVASLSGLVVLPLHLPYTTTKFALVGFSEALWIELKRRGIGVTVVCPGAIRTNIMDSTRSHEGEGNAMQFARKWQDVLQKAGKEPEEVAEIALRAVGRDRFMALTGPEAYLLYYLKRLSPAFMRHAVSSITGMVMRG